MMIQPQVSSTGKSDVKTVLCCAVPFFCFEVRGGVR
jgi:hypothetical protein